MPELQRLRPDHAPALLAFEEENRAFFAASVPDRGDDYFTHFAARHADLLAEQAAGACHFHLLMAEGGEVLGRFNLVDVADGSAALGFRLAEKATGRGLATATVRELFTLCTTAYGLTRLRAAAAVTNTASRSVLTRTGFVPTGEAPLLSGKRGVGYVRELATGLSDGV
ncbi:N-acetyltransferase [Streptomyces sp. A0642]|uniref:GNAT family N-acetyltransferase n=1 Tax=Streptomyces sp. A0642 TaxID=2563100 RepID=UPI0010A2911A|nr:GNAT family N-acetyltransferase [Streptomyces sp. A0642]THA78534.1 N-acetyltransferase [Streptomyces sp. A0642]